MRPALCVSLASFVISLACHSAHPTSPVQASTNQTAGRTVKVTADNWDDENHGSISNIAKLSWVNKRCRMWAEGGRDIDIDQTCLVVRTVGGGLVVIPNAYVDEDSEETSDQLRKKNSDRDKWLLRFYELGGGEKPRK
jgi:hypothetical protein